MKFIRSSKCSLKFATKSKLDELQFILTEYGKVCNIFIEHFWKNVTPSKSKLLKNIVDIPKETWLSFSLRQVAAREAVDMVKSTKERWKNKPDKMKMPIHKGKRMYVSSNIADLNKSKESTEFDAWLHITSIGEKHILDLPIKFHRHFNKIISLGKRLNSYIITNKYVQFSFEIETLPKKESVNCIGIDTGINVLASLNNGIQIGTEIKSMIERIKRCEYGSNGQKRARRAIKQYIDECVKQVISLNPDLIVVERLKNLGLKYKLKARLSRSIRASIGSWNWRYWLKRLEQACETNRVSFRTVLPFNTSITCSKCGCADRRNRSGTVFKCRACNHTDNADINAALNILDKFLTGPYGACCKPKQLGFNQV